MEGQRLFKLAVALFSCSLLSVAAPAPAVAQQDAAPAQQGLGERLGAQLDQGIERLTDEVREGWASLRQSVDRFGVQARVYSRLRWDKEIATDEIDVDASENGVVTLRGELASPRPKQKALELARSTVGVQQVNDQLTVAPDAPAL